MTTKKKAIALIQSLGDDISLDDVIDRLYLLRKIELGIAQVDAGDVLEHDAFMNELEMPSSLYWTRQAREDLRAIRTHIARDAPATATAYVRKLRASVERLVPWCPGPVGRISRRDHPTMLYWVQENKKCQSTRY